MRLVSIFVVVFALVLAGVVFFAVPRLMNRGQVAQQTQPQVVRVAAQDVLVATRNLAAGTVLKGDDVRWQRWPEEGLDPNFLVREKGADPQKAAVGLVVLHGIEAGQPVTAQRLLKPGEAGFLAAALTPGMRAVTIKIDVASGEGGFILPRDKVDVVLTEHFTLNVAPSVNQSGMSLPQVTTKDVSSVLMRDVKVLAIDQVMQDLDSKPKVASTATLEVDLTQAQRIEVAAQLGTLSLVLRSLSPGPEPEAKSVIVEDLAVSPFRAAILRQFNSGGAVEAQPEEASSQSALRVYHGATLAGSR